MDTRSLMSIIATSIILAVFILVIFFRYKNSPKEEDKESAKKFLEGLKDALYNKMIGIIRDFNYDDNYTDYSYLQNTILIKINETCKEYIEQELEKSTDALSVLALRALKSGLIEDYINELINSFNIDGAIEVHTASLYQTNLNESEKEDEKLTEEYSDESKYYANEESDKSKLEKTNEEELEKEIEKEEEEHKAELNPVREEEEAYNPDDDSMEILDEEVIEETSTEKSSDNNLNILEFDEDEDEIIYDSENRPISKLTGKYITTSISHPDNK